ARAADPLRHVPAPCRDARGAARRARRAGLAGRRGPRPEAGRNAALRSGPGPIVPSAPDERASHRTGACWHTGVHPVDTRWRPMDDARVGGEPAPELDAVRYRLILLLAATGLLSGLAGSVIVK